MMVVHPKRLSGRSTGCREHSRITAQGMKALSAGFPIKLNRYRGFSEKRGFELRLIEISPAAEVHLTALEKAQRMVGGSKPMMWRK